MSWRSWYLLIAVVAALIIAMGVASFFRGDLG